MTPEDQPPPKPAHHSLAGHLRVALIALVFGLTAYGLIHGLLWLLRTIEKLS